MITFEELKLTKSVQKAIGEIGFTVPTPIQEEAIPAIKSGRDLLGIAQTGTGKTAAYILPILTQLVKAEGEDPRVLILVPTRELSIQVGEDIEELKSENEIKEITIAEQDETIHTAWYVFGTKKELKEQKIVSSDGIFSSQRVLQSDFNKSYYVKIDARKTKAIPLYSRSAKILTNHPRSSYTLEKENDNFVLIIVDTKEFWSVSKYLVIEVD